MQYSFLGTEPCTQCRIGYSNTTEISVNKCRFSQVFIRWLPIVLFMSRPDEDAISDTEDSLSSTTAGWLANWLYFKQK